MNNQEIQQLMGLQKKTAEMHQLGIEIIEDGERTEAWLRGLLKHTLRLGRYWKEQADYVADLIDPYERLRSYAKHKDACNTKRMGTGCTCGLEELLNDS